MSRPPFPPFTAETAAQKPLSVSAWACLFSTARRNSYRISEVDKVAQPT